MAGVGGVVVGKLGQLYLNNNFKKLKKLKTRTKEQLKAVFTPVSLGELLSGSN